MILKVSPPEINLEIKVLRSLFVSVSCSDVMAQKEKEDKQRANSAQYDFHITKGAVWFKL